MWRSMDGGMRALLIGEMLEMGLPCWTNLTTSIYGPCASKAMNERTLEQLSQPIYCYGRGRPPANRPDHHGTADHQSKTPSRYVSGDLLL